LDRYGWASITISRHRESLGELRKKAHALETVNRSGMLLAAVLEL
jgi:hypothetical protein